MTAAAGSEIPHPDNPTVEKPRPALQAVDNGGPAVDSGYLQSWLDWQCKMIAGVRRGVVFRLVKGQLSTSYACYPKESVDELQAPDSVLRKLALHTRDSSKPVITQQVPIEELDGEQADCISLPINLSGLNFIVCLCVAPRSKSQLAAVQQLLQWGGVWLTTLARDISVRGGGGSTSPMVQEIINANDLYTACVMLANRLCSEYECERASIGLVDRLNVRLVAISQLADVDRKQQLVRSMEAAMSESSDQERALTWPTLQHDDSERLSAHQQLCRENGQLSVCSIPAVSGDQYVGVLLLERELENPFGPDEIESCSKTLADCAPVLGLKADAERGLFARSIRKIRSRTETILTPTSNRGRWQVIVGALCVLGLLFFPVTHRVGARASIEGDDKQVLVSPQGGYIKSAHYRAGDVVEEGAVIAKLDDRDLLIDQNKWNGELNKLKTSFSQALTSRDRSRIGMLQAKKQQVEAELDLVEQKLRRTEVTAPFSGVLVSGDLNQSLGAPVEIGQALFEIASLENFRLLLSVSEEDIAGIKPGQTSKVRLSSLPGTTFQAMVEELTPVSVQEDGKNVFRVQAAVESGQGQLRPGMQGVAKISTDKDPLVWVILHPLIDKLRFLFWSVWF